MLPPMPNSRVRIYSTPFCGFCRMAKHLMEREGIPAEEIDLSEDDALRLKLVEQTGWRTVPMIFIDETFVGGYQELTQLQKAGGLEELKVTGLP